MTSNLTCTQVSALLSFYIDDKLSVQLKEFVDAHLAICPSCRAKLDALSKMINGLREVHSQINSIESDNEEQRKQNEELKVNISAYIDNELSDSENMKVKKYIISNPKAREELEDMYTLRKAMLGSFEKTKSEARDDFSKLILRRIDIQEEVYAHDSFAKVVALFILIFALFTITAIMVFWV